MNRNRLLMIGFFALVMGAAVSFMVYRNLQGGRSRSVPGEDVLVAATDLQVGTKIEEKDVKYVHYPSGELPAGVFHRKDRLLGRGVILPISRGELILTNKLAAENAGYGLPSLIPPGMRAVSVRVNDTTGVAGFVLPGTRVDVLLTGNPEGVSQQETTTVLENVAVLATGQKLERNAAGEPQTTPVITLLVSPDDAQKLTLAANQGKIQLALRNPLDTKQQELAAARSDALYKMGGTPPVRAEAPRPRQKHSAAPPPPTPTPVMAPYTVEIYKGDKKEDTTF
ncbi:MAG TPA: Flp pilus assembly protein CpaB [Terriglobales bacterium]|nr:Flp pilus assembly protein CpaB [Terriglobales bacterium]